MEKPKESDQKVTIKNAGHPIGMPYTRFEIPKLSRVGDTFAITLFQIDYNNFAERKEKDPTTNSLDLVAGEIIPVARLATSLQGLVNLKNAIQEILEKAEKQNDEPK